ncbi:MAG: TIGR00374 family protein [Zetaproteobacteria bacterium CG12_big_fil_rev_8_21_14_0_65_54_13]|nr:MAG: TIGR00374 family protein [Zetaproteobacteria bacterium CG12_big_fil_rev_8_21_14_0_65_54_13]PIX54208.1 MAG: TIGR00374 family protein [Zetaproteobacteria bacterium CG_4_10_14_3_um_filter_54_28]PJA29063.1 MAG: TIGR00374 family protein [Zetaproteobacteria bacterium CG_4_9_14_3_um_filter_54_145]
MAEIDSLSPAPVLRLRMPVKKSHLLFLLKLALTVGLLTFIFRSVDMNDVWTRIIAINPAWLFSALALVTAGYALCGLRWAWISQGLGIEVSRRRKIRLYFLGMFASLFLPSTIGGDVIRGILLAKGEGRAGMGLIAAASVILDRVNGLYALLLLLTICMAMVTVPTLWWWGWLALVSGMWITMPLLPRLTRWLPERLAQLKALPLRDSHFQHMWWQSMPVSFLFQMIIIQAHVLLGIAVGLEMPWAAYAVMVGLVAVVAMLPISLNGFGVREAGYVGFATYFGADPAAAAAMAALWVIVLALSSLPGLYVLWRMGGRKRIEASMHQDISPGT